MTGITAMITVEIDGWREVHTSLSDVFKGTEYVINRYCIATVFYNGIATVKKVFTGECCDAMSHNWACGWFFFDETPHIGQVNWMPMLA